MISAENGVVGKLKQYTFNKNLIINHCLNHRLNLGAKDIWKNNSELFSFNNTIHCLCKYFTKSSKRLQILNEEEEAILEIHLKMIKPIDIRWLSMYSVIARIYDLYLAILSTLKIISEEDSCLIAEGLISRIKSIQFVSLLHTFRDIL